MEARELLKDEKKVADVTIDGSTAAEKHDRIEPYIDSKKIYHDYRWYWVGRRAQDIVLSLIALLFLWPFMLLIALIVWIDSPGASPIFTQTRVGRKGVPFQFRNLRLMETLRIINRNKAAHGYVLCAT